MELTHTQLLANIEQLNQVLANFQRNRQASIDLNQQELLSVTYRSIYGINPVLSCSSCVIEHLHQLLAWYEKNSSISTSIVPEPQKGSRKKGCSNCKKKKGE